MAAVLAVLLVIVIWYLATHGKGNVAARLVAWLLALLIGVVLLSFNDPHLAGVAASGFVGGISQAASGLTHFFGSL